MKVKVLYLRRRRWREQPLRRGPRATHAILVPMGPGSWYVDVDFDRRGGLEIECHYSGADYSSAWIEQFGRTVAEIRLIPETPAERDLHVFDRIEKYSYRGLIMTRRKFTRRFEAWERTVARKGN